MTLAWTAPSSNGGCSITSYHIYMDDGAGGTFSEVDAATVNDYPSLRSHTLTFAAADTSKTFKIYMTAENVIDEVTSETVSFVLAAVPD
jgi:hypothetical protein